MVNPEDIEADAKDEVGKVIKNDKRTLDRIYATDLINGNTVLQDKLNKRIEKSAQDEQARFHDDKIKFVKQVTVNTASQIFHTLGVSLGLNEIDTATTTAMGLIKSAQALDRFIVSMRVDIQKVGSQALSSAGMMKTVLHNEFGQPQGNEIFTQLKEQGYVREGEIKYQECNKLEQLKLNENQNSLKSRIVQSCEKVRDAIQKKWDYSPLEKYSVSKIRDVIKAIQEQEIVGPLAAAAAGKGGTLIGNPLGRFAAEQEKGAKGNKGGNKWFNGGKFSHGGHWGQGNKGSQGSKNSETGNQGSQGSQTGEDNSKNAHGSENKEEKSKPSDSKEGKANENT